MREAYGLKTTKTRRVLYRAGMGYVKVVYPFVPAFIRHAPLHYYMRDMVCLSLLISITPALKTTTLRSQIFA
jgi:uncharacterized protein (DUF2236 family)